MPRGKAAFTYGRWHERYGPLTWVVAGGKQYLIVSDYPMMKELMETRGNVYIDRDSGVLLGEIIGRFTSKPGPTNELAIPLLSGILSVGQNRVTPRTPFGPIWRQHRKFLNRALMAPIVKRDYSGVMLRKIRGFLTVLLDRPQDFILESKK